MTDKRDPDSAEQRERIDVYLGRNGLTANSTRIVPLTGDASDRRYYRVLTTAGTPFVLALHASAFDVKTLPFVNVARLLEQMPVPIPAKSRPSHGQSAPATLARHARRRANSCIARR